MLHAKIAEHAATETMAKGKAMAYLGSAGFNDLIFKRLLRGNLAGLPATDKGARKLVADAMREVKRDALYVESGEDNRHGPFIRWIGVDAGTGGIPSDPSVSPDQAEYLRLGVFVFFPRRDAMMHCQTTGRTIALFAKHAVARHHQRDGHLDSAAVRNAIREAVPYIWAMRTMAQTNGLLQAFAATSMGWFVGEPDSYKDSGTFIRFRTYLSSATEPARWVRASAELERCLSGVGREACFARLMTELRGFEAGEAEQAVFAAMNSPRYAWLRQPYVHGHDRDAAAWLQHRGY